MALQRSDAFDTVCLILSDRWQQRTSQELASINWDALVKVAHSEGVKPLVYWKLKEHGLFDLLPATVQGKLSTAYFETVANNMMLYHELARVLAALDESGIPVVVLKGAALAVTVYEDIGLRPMGDLDLLIPFESLPTAIKTMEACGYAKVHPQAAPDFYTYAGYHVEFRGGVGRGTLIELHWNLISRRTGKHIASTDWFLSHRESFRWIDDSKQKGDLIGTGRRGSTTPAYTLTPTAQIPYLAVHAICHHDGARTRSLWIYDLYLLIRSFEHTIDWDEMLRVCSDFDWLVPLRTALERVQTLYGDVLPNGLMEKLDNMSTTAKVSPTTQTAKAWAMFRTLEGSRFRIRFLLATVFPSPDYMRWRYAPDPAWTWPLYYPYRWFTVLREGISRFRPLK